jgi:hypothetical protein
VSACGDGHLELGPHAIGRRDQDRVLVSGCFEIEEAAKTAKRTVGPGTASGPCERFDCFDKLVAGVDIDPGVSVCQPIAGRVASYGVLAGKTV